MAHALLLMLFALVLRPATSFAAWLLGWNSRSLHRAATISLWIGGVGLFGLEGFADQEMLPFSLRAGALMLSFVSLGIGVAVYLLWNPDAKSPVHGGRAVLRTPAIAVFVALLAVSLSTLVPVGAVTEGRPNVVLVSLDTLRADHLGLYGYDRDTSPHLDAFASGATVFDWAYAPSHWTLPSHAALFTGYDPVALGVLHSRDAIPSAYQTLAESLQSRGWETAAFVGGRPGSYIGASHGFDQGFDEYLHAPYAHAGCEGVLLRGVSKAWWAYVRHRIGTATPQMSHVDRWLRRNHDAPFFLFLHLFDIHSDTYRLPYDAPRPFRDRFSPDYDGGYTGCSPSGLCASELLLAYADGGLQDPIEGKDLERMVSLYDGGIAYTDHELSRLFDLLRELGIEENTIVAVTSDHGESFFEHGLPLHDDLHEQNLHVPLIIRAPGGASGLRVGEVVGIIDLAATLLDLAGVEPSARSLSSWVLHGAPAQGHSPAVSTSSTEVSLTTSEWKVMLRWVEEDLQVRQGDISGLYHRPTDLGEHDDLSEAPPEDISALTGSLVEHFWMSVAVHAATYPAEGQPPVELSDRQKAALRALGYVQE